MAAESLMVRARLVATAAVFLLAMIPGLAALLAGLMIVTWNLSDSEQRTYLTADHYWYFFVILAATILPFGAAGLSMLRSRRRHRAWDRTLLVAAAWAGGLGCSSLTVVMLSFGGL